MKNKIVYTFLFSLIAFFGSAQLESNTEVSKNTISFSVIPNPASDFIYITLNGAENSSIKIIDILGNNLYFETISTSKKIDISDFKNGIYFISIESSDSKIASRRLIVKH